MPSSPFRFSEHAIDRMLEADLLVADVEFALALGETIEEYEDGSRLMLGRSGTRPLHLVVADDEEAGIMTVVTVYEPDPIRWDPSLRERRAP